MISFLTATERQCKTPVSGEPGPEMMVCGEPALPGRTACAICRPRLYYRPTKIELNRIDHSAAKPLWKPIVRAGA